jgi:hypothetical protein
MVSKLKRPSTEWEKIFAIYTSGKGLITRIYREFKKLNSPKISEPIKKWATCTKQNFFKKRNSSGQKTHEKMLIFSSHQGNANQNHTKIPTNLCWNSHYQKHHQHQVLGRIWGKRNHCTLLVGMQASATTLENNMEAS